MMNPGSMPMDMMPGMSPPPNDMPGQGMPQGGPTCPHCGQPLPMPFSQGGAPNVQIPPELMGLQPPQGQGMDQSALLAMLMGGGGGGQMF